MVLLRTVVDRLVDGSLAELTNNRRSFDDPVRLRLIGRQIDGDDKVCGVPWKTNAICQYIHGRRSVGDGVDGVDARARARVRARVRACVWVIKHV